MPAHLCIDDVCACARVTLHRCAQIHRCLFLQIHVYTYTHSRVCTYRDIHTWTHPYQAPGGKQKPHVALNMENFFEGY